MNIIWLLLAILATATGFMAGFNLVGITAIPWGAVLAPIWVPALATIIAVGLAFLEMR